MKHPTKSDVKPGVSMDVLDYGRTPDQGVTDMSHEDRTASQMKRSTEGKLKSSNNDDL